MSQIPDFTAAALGIASVVAAIPDEALGAPTPSTSYTVADLVEHVDGLSKGLQSTARKIEVPAEDLRDGDAAQLKPDWRKRVPN